MPKIDFFDLKKHIEEKIKKNGGWVNTHAHFDRAFTITPNTFSLYNSQLKEKWHLVDEVKKNSTVNQIYDRMAKAVELMISQNVSVVGTFIDVDDVIEDKAIKAAGKVREKYKKDITIKYINQVLKGVISPTARKWFELGAQFVDIIGGLPGKDKGKEAEHIDILMETAKKMKKMVHVHVDQLNTAQEKETELLIKKTIQHKMQGKTVGIHGISISAHPKAYREKIYNMLIENKVMIVSCPFAWIDGARSDEIAPIHNSITPVDEMLPKGIVISLGTDNIHDIYLPVSNGSMWDELHLLSSACRYTDIEGLVKIATTNGRKVLGIK